MILNIIQSFQYLMHPIPHRLHGDMLVLMAVLPQGSQGVDLSNKIHMSSAWSVPFYYEGKLNIYYIQYINQLTNITKMGHHHQNSCTKLKPFGHGEEVRYEGN
jgi:hypothetical protein